MFEGLVGRIGEFSELAEFVAAADTGPAALVIDGEAGIGKSTLWHAGVQHARESGMHVLSARCCAAEPVPAWSALADLLADVAPAVLDELPGVQRLAITRLLDGGRPEQADPGAEFQMLAAAMLSAIGVLERSAAVLIAVDDLQWLDASSQAVLAFVARRLRRRTALLLTERPEPDRDPASMWLRLEPTDRVERMSLRPLSLGGLHEVIAHRLGRSFPRPTMVRIGEVSGGNPFYALELARALEDNPLRSDTELPRSLAELVRRRIGALSEDVREVLLVAASAADPTVEMVSQATGFSIDRTVELLESSDGAGVVSVAGHRVRFQHPLLARGVYTDAGVPSRRRVHRKLAELVTEPELRARHLALAATSDDAVTLAALDEAVVTARARGAPAAAAELLDLAIGLGADTVQRRIAAADNHVRAGDLTTAGQLLGPVIDREPPGTPRALARAMLAAVLVHTQGYPPAVDELQRALTDAAGDRFTTAAVRTLLAFMLVRAGRLDQASVSARTALAEAEGPEISEPGISERGIGQLISAALAVNALVDHESGGGRDHAGLRRAIALEDPALDVPVTLSASAVEAELLIGSGEVEEAARRLAAVRDRLLVRGADTEMLWVSVNAATLNILRGDYPAAALDARETVERAERLGGDHVRSIALTVRGAVAAHRGAEAHARQDLCTAIELARSCRSPYAHRAAVLLAFLEVSVGSHAQAVAAIEPMLGELPEFRAAPGFPANAHLPDLVEALVALRRLPEAEQLVATVEDAAARHGRAWESALGARCRSMLLAAAGQVVEAEHVAGVALNLYGDLAMPFEQARTQLLCGQLQRRRRRKRAAEELFVQARETFERLGAQLWVARATAELERTAAGPGRGAELTGAERRIAELAASGLTNRELAAELYISPKTVEANLSRVYRKLGIRSRAELGRVMGRDAR